MTDILRAVAAVAGTAGGDLRLRTFAAANAVVVDGVRPHVLGSPCHAAPGPAMQGHLQGVEVALAIIVFLVHAAKVRQWTQLRDGILIVDIFSGGHLAGIAAYVTDLGNERG